MGLSVAMGASLYACLRSWLIFRISQIFFYFIFISVSIPTISWGVHFVSTALSSSSSCFDRFELWPFTGQSISLFFGGESIWCWANFSLEYNQLATTQLWTIITLLWLMWNLYNHASILLNLNPFTWIILVISQNKMITSFSPGENSFIYLK